MAQILLVEDDNNLRDIYGERLMAEGYEILSASDGEEALQIAAQQKPDLIISDVMMPKISGFDMLDILRQTPETKDIKIIMMTALSQAEDKSRADKLGADKYLVKSQVTLEDVARVVHDILGDGEAEPTLAAEPASTEAQPAEPVASTPAPEISVATPPAEATAPEPATPPAVPTPAPEVNVTAPPAEATTPAEPVVTAAVEPPTVPTPVPADPVAPTSPISGPEPAAPIASPSPTPAAPTVIDPATVTAAPEPTSAPVAPSTDQPIVNPIAGAQSNPVAQTEDSSSEAETTTSEMDEVAKQIESFVETESTTSNHQEPVKEPTAQDFVHAQNANEDPKVVAANTAPATNQVTQAPDSEQVAPVVPTPNPTVPPITSQMDTNNPEPTANRKKIIQPINDTAAPDIHQLYEQEMADQAASTGIATPVTPQNIEAPAQQQAVEEEVINPIVGQDAPIEVAPPQLETFDVTKIDGISTNPDEEFLTANPAQPTDGTPPPVDQTPAPQETEAPSPATDTAEAAPSDPNDPKNIAL